MDPRWIAVLLCLPMVAGCLVEEGAVPDPEEGDLELTISAPRTVFSPGEASISLNITLKNICDHDVLVDDSFHIGTTLHPKAIAENGTEIVLMYPLVDRDVRYSPLSPGETMIVSEALDPSFFLIDGIRRDFNWDIPGTYSITISWWGSKGSDFNLTSNELAITIGEYLDPVDGDLELTISMERYDHPVQPEYLNLTTELKNVCDHPVLVEDNVWIGYTLSGYAFSPNGTKIVFFPSYYIDYSPHYAPLYPWKSLRRTEDLTDYSNWEKIDGDKCEWDQTGTYTLTMVWSGVKHSNFSVTSNEISITITDCPHPLEGNLSLTISMSQYPFSSNDMNLTVEITNVCDHPVLVEDWFYFGCSLSGVVIIPNYDIVEIRPEYYVDHHVTYTPLEPDESKTTTFDLSTLDHEWDDPGIYHVSVVYHDELNNSMPVSSDEITFEIIAST